MPPSLDNLFADRSTEPSIESTTYKIRPIAFGKTASGKPLNVRSYPKFETLEEERLYRKQHLAAAFRVFADKGFDEGIAGHM
jgi:hypothetical protein